MDWYMASLSHSIYAVNGGKTKLKDHLLTFDSPYKQKPTLEQSRSNWLACVGIAPE